MRFIGDVHGKFKSYKKVIRDVPISIQVGDMGVGFKKYRADRELIWDTNPPYDAMKKGDHRFIRGNHDNPGVCKQQELWIPDGELVHNKIFCLGGALSVDRAYRTEGIDYWSNEELSHQELNTLVDKYESIKPEYVVTHDCPDSIANEIMMAYRKDKSEPSITRQALESMFYIHQPKYWIFGHWHHSMQFSRSGTNFICLAELEYIDLDLN